MVLNADPEIQTAPEASVCEVFMIRHGERLDKVPGNDWKEQCPERWYDPPLTSEGERQAAYATLQLQYCTRFNPNMTVDVIYCSPLQRCVSTAAYFSEAFGAPIKIVPGLGECCGSMKGKMFKRRYESLLSMDELQQLCPQATFCEADPVIDRFVGESGETCIGRLAQNESHIVVVSHKEAINDLAELAGMRKLRSEFASIARFTCSNAATPEERWQYQGHISQGHSDDAYDVYDVTEEKDIMDTSRVSNLCTAFWFM